MTPEDVASSIGKFCVILDKETNRSIAYGLIRKVKLNPILCISFDNVYFFPVDESSSRAKFKFLDSAYGSVSPHQEIPSSWKKSIWTKRVAGGEKYQADVYVENDYIDPEIYDLVIVLNRIKGIVTGGSCCGHAKTNAFVTLSCKNFSGLNFLLRNINPFLHQWFIMTNEITSPNFSKEMSCLTLLGRETGVQVYEQIKILANHLLQKGEEEGILIPENEITIIFPKLES